MAESYVTYAGDGVEDTFEITFPLLTNEHIEVYIDGVEDTSFTVSGTTLTTSTVADIGEDVLIKRVTDVGSQYEIGRAHV